MWDYDYNNMSKNVRMSLMTIAEKTQQQMFLVILLIMTDIIVVLTAEQTLTFKQTLLLIMKTSKT